MVELLLTLLMSIGVNCNSDDISITKDNIEGKSGNEKVNFVDTSTGISYVAIGTEQNGWGVK